MFCIYDIDILCVELLQIVYTYNHNREGIYNIKIKCSLKLNIKVNNWLVKKLLFVYY